MEHKHYNFYIIKSPEIKDELAAAHDVAHQAYLDRAANIKSQLLAKGIEVEALAQTVHSSFNRLDGSNIFGIFSKTILPGWRKYSDYRDEESRYHLYPLKKTKEGKELAAIFEKCKTHYYAAHDFLEKNGLDTNKQVWTGSGLSMYNTMLVRIEDDYLLIIPKVEVDTDSDETKAKESGLEFLAKHCERITAGQYVDNYESKKMFVV